MYLIVQCSLLLAIYFAGAASLNAGLITSIWSICPFFIAITDYFLFNEKLKSYHILGTFFIVLSTILISLVKVVYSDSNLGDATPAVVKYGRVEVWVPILFGFITPIFFTTNGML